MQNVWGLHIKSVLVESILRKRQILQTGAVQHTYLRGRHYPWRERGRSAYEVLIAETLLRRTTSGAVSRVYEKFLGKFPSLEHLRRTNKRQLVQALLGVGLQEQRYVLLKEMSRYLLDVEGGVVPGDLARLLRIPGIGQYGARAMLTFHFDTAAAVVDSNVGRVLQRVFLDSLEGCGNQQLVQKVADMLLPTEGHREFNFGMLDIGAIVCRPVSPRCGDCPLSTACDYNQDGVERLRKGTRGLGRRGIDGIRIRA